MKKTTKKFENFEKNGVGGFAIVYRAKIKNSNELRAIKIIDIETIKSDLRTQFMKNDIDEEFLPYYNGFINEIKNMKKCSQENTNKNSIICYEYFCTETKFFNVMELCDCNLQLLLNKKENGFNDKEIHEILNQLNNTFKIMDKNNIIHRDLKLENILVKFENKEKNIYTVKLTDYGASKQLISTTRKMKTHIGTILTMAPEILLEEEYDSKCDIWSLGVIIYQLYFKQYPYNAQTESGLLNLISKRGHSCLKKTNNPQLDDLIRKLLVSDPKKRLSWKQYFYHPFFQ